VREYKMLKETESLAGQRSWDLTSKEGNCMLNN